MLKREIVVPPAHIFPPSDWRITETRWLARYQARAETVFALSNGYLGVRGTHEEARPAAAPGTFVNGFHETWPIVHAEEAYGLARVGQTMVNVPDASALELFVDDEPLFLPTARTFEYERVLDMRDGTLTRDVVWSTPSGKHARVRSSRLVSLEHRHLLAMAYEVTLDHAAPVAICSRVRDRSAHGGHADDRADPRLARRQVGRVLEGRFAEGADGRILLGYRTKNSGMTLAVGVDHVVDVSSPHELSTVAAPDGSEVVLTIDARPGEPIRLVKYACYQSSRAVPAEELGERCSRTLARARRDGFDALLAAQRSNLDRFWDRADVQVTDRRRDPVRVQQAVRWNLFQLAQASWRAEGSGIPAKGLTGAAYDGHYFWDTEAYVLPFLAYTQPRIARNLLRFRHSMLPKARERAATLCQRGALFPWRTINGDEASASYQAGTAQYHLNADIAYAIRRYVDVRGDIGFLVEVGAELLVETARMWADLGFYGADGCFHIHGVTGPDEYTTVVNNNAFTNLLARLNLRYAARALRRLADERPDAFAALSLALELDPSEPEAWERAARHMYVPYDEERGITPQDDTFLEREPWDVEGTSPDHFPLLLHFHPLVIYRYQVLKQADVVMAMFLLGNEFSLDAKRRNFAYYDPLTTGDSSLSSSIQSIVAAEIGAQDAACQHFDFGLLMDLADVAGNASDGVHVASSAGTWMALVFGFGGVRDFDGRLTIDPRLPARFGALRFSLWFQGRQLRVHLTHEGERYVLEDGEPLVMAVRGVSYELKPDAPLELPTP
ncbi:MAG TPA: glycosyl hydrolase family 65 protein [Acidimicrobiales bacterium]|nr:glycosyl hydrolase family 65 protein [Acidimicrobiales bacterium]